MSQITDTFIKERLQLISMRILQAFSRLESLLQITFQRAKYKLKYYLRQIPDEAKEYAKIFLVYIILYGMIINYSLTFILKNFAGVSVGLGPLSIPAWGLAYYMIREELPALIKDCR